MSRVDEVSQQIMRLLEREETVHLRILLQRLPYGLREIKRALAKLEAEGAVESFRHGGYTFYRLAGQREEEEGEGWSSGEFSEDEPHPLRGGEGLQAESESESESIEEGEMRGEGEETSAPEEAGQ
ncbi:MAG TPA: hypothetical protein ENF83_03630 [Candidatus Korarchaeota archaeon]|nr:hypothetical protein [Candidatus Korarchaeota archaeon]